MRTFNEWKSGGETTITVVARDEYGKLAELLNYIKKIGNGGHSFSIIVDPDGDDKAKFDWDGDGSDAIKEIKVS